MTSIRRPDERGAAQRTWLLILPAWLAACLVRPFVLGFYDDDWFSLLIPARVHGPWTGGLLAFYMEQYANRPTLGVLTYVMTSVCGESARAWQIGTSLFMLATALAIRAFGRGLARLMGSRSLWAADLGAVIWLLIPFNLGLTAWSTTSPCMMNVLLFALTGTVLFEAWRQARTAWLLPAALFFVGIQTYESFYGGFLPLLLIGVACGVPRRIGWRAFGLTGAAFVTAQLLAVVVNRLAPYFGSTGPSKTFYAAWPLAFLDNLMRLRYFIGHSAREVSPAVELVLLVLLAGCGGVALRQLRRPATSRVAARAFVLWAACGLGLAIGLLVLSVVGRRLLGVGLGSRTATAPAFWLVVSITVGLAVLPRRPRLLRPAALTATAALCLMFAVASNLRLRDWGGAWQVQAGVLAEAPVADLSAAAPGSVVMYFGPEMYKRVRTFGYYGNLHQAMRYRYPELGALHFCCVARDNWITSWDGRRFEQRLKNPVPGFRYNVWHEFDAPEVWVWVRGTGRARQVDRPFVYEGATNNTVADVFAVELPFAFVDQEDTDEAEVAAAED